VSGRAVWTVGGMAAALAVAVAFAPAMADERASAAVPASAAPSAAAATPAGPDFAEAPFLAEKSKKPTAEEWKGAPEVQPTRRGPRGAKCHVWRVREWVRVSCPDLVTASVAMLGGTTEGMAFWIDPVREGQDGKLPAGGEVMFPVRPGDRRVVQFLSFGPGYEGPFTQLPALVVQESWVEGATAPVLLLH
jgi:hypothetical protein